MFEGTRYARVQPSVEPLRSIGQTRMSPLRPLGPQCVEALFRDKQRMMASAVREERQPGLFVFAAHVRYGHVARLWLEASEQPRAGLIGRHDAVDLRLPLDDALSLRHLLFVVRQDQGAVRFAALDLESHHGLRLESGEPARLVEATGPLFVSASEFVFFCVLTGQPVPWDSDAADPWATLAARRATRTEPRTAASPGPVVGRVEVRSAWASEVASFTAAALARGVLVGRDPRCDLPTHRDTVSRVHVVLLCLDDEPFIIDAGSTNGTWKGGREVKIARLRDGDELLLGRHTLLGWRDAQ